MCSVEITKDKNAFLAKLSNEIGHCENQQHFFKVKRE